LPLLLVMCPVSAGLNEPTSHRSAEFPVNLEFSIDDIEFVPSIQFRGIRARCTMMTVAENQVRCTDATLAVNHSPFGQISLAARIAWHSGRARWTVEASGVVGSAADLRIRLAKTDVETHVVMDVKSLALPPTPDVIGLLPPVLAEHDIEAGTLTLHAECRTEPAAEISCSVSGNVFGLSLNGVNVVENATMDFDATYADGISGTNLEFDISLREGAVYIEPGFSLGGVKPGFFLGVEDAPIALAARIVRPAGREIRILSVDLSHPDIVDMHFDGDLTFQPSPRWSRLEAALQAHDVEKFYSTYMQPIALDTAFGSLETAGAVYVDIVGIDNEIDSLDLRFEDVYIDDEAGRFALYGIDGEIELHGGEEDRESHLAWIGGALYRIEIGPGRIDWVSAERGLKIARWKDVAIFDGEFRMDTLEIADFGLADTKVVLSGTLTPISLEALTSAFGWIPLSGKLSGTIPRLTYSANRLAMNGDLEVNVFDGRVVIRELQIDRLFSTVPVLSASIDIDQLALDELTRTFSFGNITGRVNGKIDDLELQAWRPIRFDASLATPVDDDSPHRISRQAVDNLGRLAAGTGTALSQGWLGFVPNYSYGRLGLGCRLANGYCLMSGIKNADDGDFFILTRGGILPPWIDIKGSGRRISWQTLVDGIKQISRGDWELDIGS